MVYQRIRNSRYASYSRNCQTQGSRAQFSVPMHRNANFSPMMDMINQGMTYGGDMLQHAGQAANRFVDVPYAPNMNGMGAEIASRAGGALNAGREFLGNGMQGAQDLMQNAGDGIMGAVRGAGQYFSNNPDAATAAKAAAGVGGIAGGAAAGAKVANKFAGQGAAIADIAHEVSDAAPVAMGLRQKAGAMLKNPYALAAGGAGVLGAGAYGANRMMNQEQ